MKIAVVLANLGGPDNQAAVEPFLFNLFNDKNIIRLPKILRMPLAHLISRRRAPVAREIYAKLGGGSPLLANTKAQAEALEMALGDLGAVKCFVAMRYWHPMSDEVARQVADFAPDRIIFLPLYPQFSTTTGRSSYQAFRRAAQDVELGARVNMVCCYPEESGFIAAMARDIRAAYDQAASYGKPRVLMSAHGLPEKIIRAGDPYQWQCEQTAKALAAALDIPGLDWLNCYQSRVGPMKWIGPATEDEIRRAGRDKVPVVVAPIAFVSEHAETLVELDIEYRELAVHSGAPFYARVPTVATSRDFIAGLAGLVRGAVARNEKIGCGDGGRFCPAVHKDCPATAGRAA